MFSSRYKDPELPTTPMYVEVLNLESGKEEEVVIVLAEAGLLDAHYAAGGIYTCRLDKPYQFSDRNCVRETAEAIHRLRPDWELRIEQVPSQQLSQRML